jgi:hypothetical protein
MRISPNWSRPLAGLLALLLVPWLLATAPTGEFRARVQLVWGTDDTKPKGESLTPLDEKTREKFLRHLRWKNYFVVKSAAAAVSAKEPTRLSLSKQCSVDLRDLGDGHVEIHIHSLGDKQDPKLVDTKKLSVTELRKGHTYVFGGDSKDNWDDAWFVVVTSAE